ncbi:acetylxylan esterase [Arthrobacter alpinus]|nr:acetylxylan esterase [Arthrobacter alpinus]
MDAFRAIEAAQAHPEVAGSNVIVTGISQGGGLAIAAAGLAAGRLDGVIAVMADVPFLQDFPAPSTSPPAAPTPKLPRSSSATAMTMTTCLPC